MQNNQTNSTYVHGAYYPSWRVYKNETPSDMRLDLLTHVYYAFARFNDQGSLTHLDLKADTQLEVDGARGCMQALVRQKKTKYPRLKLLLSIGGASGSTNFASVAADPIKRNRFASSAKTWVDKYGFDGVDIDWEHPINPAQGQSFLKLMQALRQKLPSPQYQITTALPAGQWCLKNIPLANVSNYIDHMNLMCYDFVGPWTKISGFQSQLYPPAQPSNPYGARSCDSGVSYAVSQSFPASKLIMGIPVYGQSFLGVDKPGQTCSRFGGAGGTFQYRDLPRPGAREIVNMQRVAAYSLGGNGGFVSYDIPETVAVKAEYVKEKGLGGMFYWTGTGDAQAEDRSLVSAGYKGLYE